MKYLLPILSFVLVSCASDMKNWSASDPNNSATTPGDIMASRAYSSDSIGLERQTMSDREIGNMTKRKENGVKLSGELSVGVGANF